MKLDKGIKSISISSHTKKIYEDLNALRPNHISFSLMLAIAADEYIKNHKNDKTLLDDFSECEDMQISPPHFFAPMHEWIDFISAVDNNKISDVKEQMLRLQRMLDRDII